MNPQILDKFKELEKLIEDETKNHNLTMYDFFKPIAAKMMKVIDLRVQSIIKPYVSTHICEKISIDLSMLDGETLLKSASDLEETDLDSALILEVKRFIKNNQKLQAIKHVKEQTGLSLYDAKQYVDNLETKMKDK